MLLKLTSIQSTLFQNPRGQPQPDTGAAGARAYFLMFWWLSFTNHYGPVYRFVPDPKSTVSWSFSTNLWTGPSWSMQYWLIFGDGRWWADNYFLNERSLFVYFVRCCYFKVRKLSWCKLFRFNTQQRYRKKLILLLKGKIAGKMHSIANGREKCVIFVQYPQFNGPT